MALAALARSASDSRLAIAGRPASTTMASATLARRSGSYATFYVRQPPRSGPTKQPAAKRDPHTTAMSWRFEARSFAASHLRPFVPSAYNSHRSTQAERGTWTPRETKMDNATTVGHVAHGHAHDEPHEELGFWRKYIFSRRSQGDRHPVRHHRPPVPALRFLLDDADAVSARLSGQPDPADRQPVQSRQGARRHHAAGVLQPAGRDARDDHGVPRRRAAGGRRLRQFRDAAADRRARHGVPQAQHDELLGVLPRRRRHARQLLPARRRRAIRLDLVSAALGHHRHQRPDDVADRHDLPDHVVAARRGQFHRDDHSIAREGPQLHAAAVLRLGAVRDRRSCCCSRFLRSKPRA